MDLISQAAMRTAPMPVSDIAKEYWVSTLTAPNGATMYGCQMDALVSNTNVTGKSILVACDPFLVVFDAATGAVRVVEQYEGVAGTSGMVEAACFDGDGQIAFSGYYSGLNRTIVGRSAVTKSNKRSSAENTADGSLARLFLAETADGHIVAKSFYNKASKVNLLTKYDKTTLEPIWCMAATTTVAQAGIRPITLADGNVLSVDHIASSGGYVSPTARALTPAGGPRYAYRFYRAQTAAETMRDACALKAGGWAGVFFSASINKPVLFTVSAAGALVASSTYTMPDIKKLATDSLGAVYGLSIDASNVVRLAKFTSNLATMTWYRQISFRATMADMLIVNDIIYIALVNVGQLTILKLPIDGSKTGTKTVGALSLTYSALTTLGSSSGLVTRATGAAMAAQTFSAAAIPAGSLNMKERLNPLKITL